jgi:hypothetical protein
MTKDLTKIAKRITKDLSDTRIIEYIRMEGVTEFPGIHVYEAGTPALKVTSISQFMRGVELYVVAYAPKQYRIHTSSGFSSVKAIKHIIIELAVMLESTRLKNIYKEPECPNT